MKLKMLTAALASATSIAASGAPSFAAETTQAGLDGEWMSIACEVRPQPTQEGAIGNWWLTRDLKIEEDRIEAVFTTYSGPGCEAPLNELHFAGRIDVRGQSSVLDGAVEADLTIDEYVRIKPLAEGFASFLNSAPQGTCLSPDWKVGEARDVHEQGCRALGVQPDAPTVEYEVIGVRGDMIHFGARPTDGTFIVSPDKRPRALLVGAARK